MFIQHLADESHTQAKMERKPRRNIQYKDVGKSCTLIPPTTLPPNSHHPANAVSHQDNLEFLEDVVPKTVPYKKIKAAMQATQARLRGEITPELKRDKVPAPAANGTSKGLVNGGSSRAEDDPSMQLELEMRQAATATRDGDVSMTG